MAVDCTTCRALERTISILEEQLKAKDAQLAVLLGQPSQTPMVPQGTPTAPVLTQKELNEQMADFVDEAGNPFVLIDGIKVPLEEYQDVRRRLDIELTGGRLA